ncbi:phosphoribosyl-ATP diphosphatase [Gluconobacter kondonii]|uniref:phosphoribosyl-ATP diphosphatase n=1 Tax=Gluconobacter kondonii TaxID=941463 RepID=UPI001B8B7729|nr:phosphoribosyl-ATP diphosphatase [Gluconobacter kondonii]MBS1054458.1 phosphoribosyl-ATP diphosphatase [Gluconobacter kondonii]MBS1065521.1 phosphoribosyl-ATP diphosphatase [Gluconobacter kondonii]MBS1080364.1 phosphoribosyl-ATP diphosphatase [Gluconobacter kondonii]MBS1083494.1 phosphoribosyl-ATP diphosphatase [Gluconobacter kondonii]
MGKPATKPAPKPSKQQDDKKSDLLQEQILQRLYDTVQSRRGTDPSLSHSARLMSRGRNKIAQKFGEEAVECLIEAVNGNRKELIGESADVLYHLIVMWVDAGVSPEDVWTELKRREGTSGIVEKAARPKEKIG